MDFALSTEQQDLVRSLRAFARRDLLPKYQIWDQKEEFFREQWQKLGELGLLGLGTSPAYGGQKTDCVTAGLATEEIAKGDFNVAYGIVIPTAMGEYLEAYGSERVKEEWLKPMVTGEKVIALAVTEPHCGSDAAAMRTRAVREGEYYLLKGEKSGVTLMMVADALVLFAKTNPELGARGISAFLVPTDSPGAMRQTYKDMGEKAIARGSIFLEDVKIPASYLLGKENAAFREIMQEFNFTRVLLALMCIGAAEITIEETIEYLKQRTAFGRPLSFFQGASFPLVEHYSRLEAVRWLCYYALWLRDQGLPHSKESSICKWLGPQTAAETIHTCLLLHGHYGYTQEFPIEQRLRDVIGLEMGDGTAQIQKIVIARELFGKEFVS